MHGPAGTGKSSIWKVYREIYGDYGRVISQRALEDKFNSDWVDSTLFVLAEEVINRQEMWGCETNPRIYTPATGPRRFEQVGKTAFFRGKMIAAYRQRNHMNIAFLSNEDLPLPIDNDDRRYLVIYTPPKLSEAFYNELWTEIAQGGIEAFYHYLLHLDLSNFNPKSEPPGTVAKRDLAEVSKQSEDQFIEEWMVGDTPYPFGPCGGKQLYLAYTRWCRANGVRFPRNSIQFLNRVGKMPGWLCGKKARYRV